MAVIKSGATTDQLTIDATSKAARTTLYDTAGNPLIPINTYRATLKGFAITGSNTAPFMIIQGSNTKTLYVTKVIWSASATTGATTDVWVARFTTITGGTSASVTVSKAASANPGSTAASVLSYSVLPTTATRADSDYVTARYEVVTAAVGVSVNSTEWDFGDAPQTQPFTISGTGEYFGMGSVASGASPVWDVTVEWYER